MTCSTCGAVNDAGRKFCGDCGSPLTSLCAVCGSANPPSVRFCGECGASLLASEGSMEIERPTPTTERRTVSVLFADLVGFTTISESRDPEEVRDLLSRYFDVCRQLIVRYGGTVEKFIGDAVMAVWGTPVANEDDAERAVRAGLELVAAVAGLGEEVGVPELRARAGVLTGEAAVNLQADGQGMVAGDLVNSAARIQSEATPGTVLVGEATRRASEAAVEYEHAGLHELKGKAEPVELWRAVRIVGLMGGTMRSAGLEPPFVGRDRELRLLKELYHATAEEGRANLVSVVGVGGIGKSRLMWELEKYLDGLAGDFWWHRGRCLAYGEGVAFWALAEMVRGRSGIVEDEDPASASVKLRTAIATHLPDPTERRFVEPRLAQLLGLEDRGSGDHENLFSAWRMFFERMSDSLPVVLVFEDIHWADSALLDFVEYLLDWARDRPIFVLTLARPELMERRPTWGAGKRAFTSLYLEPLATEAMEALLLGPVPGIPDDLRARILERAEGVPFYAVETVRMLLDRGLIVREGDAYRPVGAIETLEVPETLQALLAARLDGLAPEERFLLQDASVLGRTFTVPGLLAMTRMAQPDVERLLTSLVRKEVLILSVDPMSPDRGQYGFLQDLVKKVAYDTMSKKERRDRHLTAAAFLESSGIAEDEIVEVVAAHYLDAFRAAPDAPDAGEVQAKARDRLVRAGQRAASLGATLAAQGYFDRAAELAKDQRSEAGFLEQAGMMASAGSRPDDAASRFERAIELFESQGATHPVARVSARHAEVLWQIGRLEQGLAMMDRSFEILSSEQPDEDLARLAAQVGRFLFFAGDTDLGAQRTEAALDLAEAIGLPEILSEALNTKALILNARGRREESRVLLQHALEVALEHEKLSAALRAYNNLADLLGCDDRYEEADRWARDGLALARKVGNRFWELSFIGLIYRLFALGRWDEALTARAEFPNDWRQARAAAAQGYLPFGVAINVHRGDLEEAERMVGMCRELEASADVQERAEFACAMANLLLAQGRAVDALSYAEAAFATRDVLAISHQSVKESFPVAADAAFELADLDKVEELLAIVREIPPGRSLPFLQAQAMRVGAKLAEQRGGSDRIEPDFKAATGLFREMSVPFWMAVTLLEHGGWLVREGRAADARPLVDEAREIFERLGAKPWLDRLDEVSPVEPAIR